MGDECCNMSGSLFGGPLFRVRKRKVVMAVKLTEKQKRFVDYYIKTGNATEAAIKAGYSRHTARQMGAENLTKPYIVEAIAERNKQLEDERIAGMKEIKEFWTRVVRDENAAMGDRLKASEFIARTNAAFKERHEHTGKDGGPIEIDDARSRLASRIAGIAARARTGSRAG